LARSENGKAVFLIEIAGITKNDTLKSAGPAGIRLPVAPLDSIAIDQGINLNNNQLPLTGSVVFGGGPGLATVNFDSLFPLEEYPVWAHRPTAQQPARDMSWYDNLLRSLASNNTVFRLIISEPTGSGYYEGGVEANRLVFDRPAMVSSYSVTDEEGDCLWYSVGFTEYKRVSFTTVKRALGPETYKVNQTKYNTALEISNLYRVWDVRWQNILALNPKMKQPAAPGKKAQPVINQNQPIAMGTIVRLRKATGNIDAIDDFRLTNTTPETSSA
jgi:hypothetical protein